MYSSSTRILAGLKEEIGKTIDGLPRVDPEFDLQIQWSPDYDGLFAKKGSVTPESQILERTFSRGRCLVVGRGGGGKTRMLHRTMRLASANGIVPIFIDLKNWTGPDYADWRDWVSSDIGAGASFLLERFSMPATNALTLDVLPPDTPKLLIVDGLNEIAAPEGQQILLALDDFARDQVGMSVLVADRLSRRDLPSPSRWALGAVQPVPKDQIDRHVDVTGRSASDVEALGTPYFLDAAIKTASLGTSRAETLHRFFTDHGRVSEKEHARLAEAAFAAYAKASSRTFPYAAFVELLGDELVGRLITDGVLVRGQGDDVQFLHHLLHDHLAASHVAAMADDGWVSEVFQAISFGGSSFDTISMVFSLLAAGRADKFLREVYDWNPYAAAYALADSISAAAAPSREIQIVILAMLAEKVFDMVEPTSQRASDALSLIETPDGAAFRACGSLAALLDAVNAIDSKVDWFQKWRGVFTLGAAKPATDADLQEIDAADSVIGWTMANVGKRISLSADQQASMRSLAEKATPTTKWRVAHLLGAWPSVENVRALDALLTVGNAESVRYGALRSMIEAAARGDGSVRKLVLELLGGRADNLANNRSLVAEVRRAMWIRADLAPADWSAVVRRISLLLYELDDDLEARTAWQEYVERAAIRYRSGRDAAIAAK